MTRNAHLGPLAILVMQWLLLIVTTPFLSTTQVLASVVIPPIGLAPGSQYQLVFFTEGLTTFDMEFNDTQAPYNAFVTAEAARNPLLPTATWRAVTSTLDGTDASVNAPWLGLPVYNTLGIQVTDSQHSFYSNHTVAIDGDQFGESYFIALVVTGSSALGIGIDNHRLGNSIPAAGESWLTGESWANNQYTFKFYPASLYALSDAITVPTPEPSSLALAVFGLASLAAWSWRRRASAADRLNRCDEVRCPDLTPLSVIQPIKERR